MKAICNNYKTDENYDDLVPEPVKQMEINDYAKILKIAKVHIYAQGDIEKIKRFHEKNKLSYDEPYYVFVFGQGYDPFMDGGFPINWALSRGENDFVLWLIQTKGVTLSHLQKCGHSCFHSLVMGIVNGGLKSEHRVLVKLLVDSGLSINTIQKKHTPLSLYMHMAKNLDGKVFQLFFDHGAKISHTERSERGNQSCNLIFEAIKRAQSTSILIKLYKARFYAHSFVGIEYFQKLIHMKNHYTKYFSLLWLRNQQHQQTKVPKPIMHIISKLAVEDEERTDIKVALTDKMSHPDDGDMRSVTPLQFLFENWRCSYTDIVILNPKFFDQPLSVCYEIFSRVEQ